ncbi:hypothetical protein ACFV98_02530 [Streptomyces violascens]|uniref:hypothetical protein n=1 Tax=Streptomyces violascens TaxID=67381 RepID=UPI00366039EB
MTATTSAAELTTEQILITVDAWDRAVLLLPDPIAERLAASSHDGVKDYGYCHFESRRYSAGAWETRAVHAMFEAVLAAYPDHQGLSQYRKYGCGYFYGWVVGESGWDITARTWSSSEKTSSRRSLCGIHINHDGTSHFGS